ncbi:hypothetical protein [Clostridium sp.]|uniref:hypothetical protein n=1 Tax=Clostridium sp. TaxID=1506 RepID=UPI001A612538|nr:hypothetical protein [Clostridium sp.]MBK5234073.1 hypothetical protein [Clostridium sp.]
MKIETKKLGINYYIHDGKAVDKNGGLYEYGLIKNALIDLEPRLSNNVYILVNGLVESQEDEIEIINQKKAEGAKVFFIMTDTMALETSADIINNCDILLHQMPMNSFKQFIHIPQFYSYVPELFYKRKLEFCEKEKKLIFGGNNNGRDGKLKKVLVGDGSEKLIDLFVKSYDVDGQVISDNRLPYDEYMHQLETHEYTYVVARELYNKIGWVTPRFIEAIMNGVYPLVDSEYDKTNHFAYGFERVEDYQDIQYFIENDLANAKASIKLMAETCKDIERRKDYFRELIAVLNIK